MQILGLVTMILLVTPSLTSAQSNVVMNMVQERDDLLNRTIENWLNGRPMNNKEVVHFVELDIYLLNYQYAPWIERIDPARPLPPQLFLQYLETKHGIRLSPPNLLRGQKIRVWRPQR